MFWQGDALPGLVTVGIGAYADPHFPQPRVSVHEEHQHDWLRLPGDMEHLD